MNTTNKNPSDYGFSLSDREEMERVFRMFPEVERVLLFGSRAMNTFKPASDVDIAIVYSKNDYHIAAAIKERLEEETKIPYFFDVLDHKNISSDELKEHIRLHGIEIYKKSVGLNTKS